MEIIRRGNLPEEKLITTTCDNCNTEFRFARGEATQRYDQRDGDYIEIKCPLCKKSNYIANKILGA